MNDFKRYELVYIEWKDNKKPDYVHVRRMNNEPYSKLLHLTQKGTPLHPPLHAKFTEEDIIWFLQWGFHSFLMCQV